MCNRKLAVIFVKQDPTESSTTVRTEGLSFLNTIKFPGLIFVQKPFFLGLFLGELIFGGAYYWKEFCVSKWVGLENKNSLK